MLAERIGTSMTREEMLRVAPTTALERASASKSRSTSAA
jgi:hypothetical protein